MERPPSARARSREVARFLGRLERELERIDRSLFLAWWNQVAGLSREGTEPWDLRRGRLLGRPPLLDFLRSALDRPHPGLLARRLELARRVVEDSMVEQHPSVVRLRARLSREVVGFRPRWGHSHLTMDQAREIERTDPDRERRRRAYLARHEIDGRIEAGLRELIRRRNDRARSLGYRSFPEFRLSAEGLTEAQLERMLDAVGRVTRPAARAVSTEFREADGDGAFYPWDEWIALGRRQSLPDRAFPGRTMTPDTLSGIRAWGFRYPRRALRILRRSSLTGGMTLAVRIPDDVRVVVSPSGSHLYYGVLFHELGHAVESLYTRGPTHLLRGPENVPGFAGFREGIGGFFEEIAGDRAWLATRKGLSSSEVEAALGAQRGSTLWWTSGTVAWVANELAIYRRPSAPLAEAFVRRWRNATGYDEYPAGSIADPFWVEAGFYAKSYLLASLVAAQLHEARRAQVPGPLWPNRKVIPWLARTWFRNGIRYDWVPRMREVTGRPFGPRAWVERWSRAG